MAVAVAAALQRYVGGSLAAARRLRQRGGGAKGSGGNEGRGEQRERWNSVSMILLPVTRFTRFSYLN